MAGGILGRFALFYSFYQSRMSATRNFFRNLKIMFLAKGIVFWNLKNTYNYVQCARKLNHDSQKSTLKFISYNTVVKIYPWNLAIVFLGLGPFLILCDLLFWRSRPRPFFLCNAFSISAQEGPRDLIFGLNYEEAYVIVGVEPILKTLWPSI